MELAKETADSIYEEAAAEQDEKSQEKIRNWAKQSESAAKLEATVKLARTVDGVPIEAAELDRDVWLLNCNNGTLNLRTGELRPADPADLITKSTGVEFDPEAKCPAWDKFVLWAMQDRKDLVEFVQRALGYSLTGDVSERLVFLLHGTGRNGKSTMLKTFRHLLGDYALRVASTTFEKPRGGGGGGAASPHLAQLKGARFVTTSEVEDGMQLATTMLKDMTGDETVSARELWKAPVEFMPEFKPWIAANHWPQVDADDQAIWDRLRLVPFDNRVSDRDMDRELGDKLRNEAPGVLAWAIRGCLDWRRLGELPTPDAVVEATKAYRDEMDTFTDFLNSTEQSDPNMPAQDMSPTALFEDYLAWAKKNDAPRLNTHAFKRRMEKLGYTQKNRGERGRVWMPPSNPKSPLASKKNKGLDYGAMAGVAKKKSKRT
jgi:putative DNA primase/helicase